MMRHSQSKKVDQSCTLQFITRQDSSHQTEQSPELFKLLCLNTTVLSLSEYLELLRVHSCSFVHGFPLENVRAVSLGIEWG